jgi:GT2 family glycosyltransferase
MHQASRPEPSSASRSHRGLYPLFVIVLNWNLPEDTIACVESVLASKSADTMVIVVDNGSSDNSVAMLQARFGEQVMLVETGKNLGFAGGVNVGIRRALQEGAGSVLLLNNDTVVDATMIRQLITVANAHPEAGLIGPVIHYFDAPERIWRFADNEHRVLPITVRVPDRRLEQAGGVPFPVDYITACGMLIRREVLEQVGLFDEAYFMYFEDADFCRRVRRVGGFEIWCAPEAKMWHKVSLSARKNKPLNRYAMSWGRARFYRDHPHGVLPVLTLPYLLLRSLASTLADLRGRDWDLIGPLWTGTMDGYWNRSARLPKPGHS